MSEQFDSELERVVNTRYDMSMERCSDIDTKLIVDYDDLYKYCNFVSHNYGADRSYSGYTDAMGKVAGILKRLMELSVERNF